MSVILFISSDVFSCSATVISFFSFLSLSVEIVVDILYAILDPRITYGMKSKKNYVLLLKTYLIRKKLIKDLLEKQASESIISTNSKSEVK